MLMGGDAKKEANNNAQQIDLPKKKKKGSLTLASLVTQLVVIQEIYYDCLVNNPLDEILAFRLIRMVWLVPCSFFSFRYLEVSPTVCWTNRSGGLACLFSSPLIVHTRNPISRHHKNTNTITAYVLHVSLFLSDLFYFGTSFHQFPAWSLYVFFLIFFPFYFLFIIFVHTGNSTEQHSPIHTQNT